jgi:hypothetical protein
MKRSGRWVPYVAGLLTFVIAFFAVGTVSVDWLLRSSQTLEFVSSVEGSEAAMTWTQENVQAVLEGGGENPTDEQVAAAASELRAIAAEGRDRIKAAGDAVAAVPVSPWHGDLLRAREAYLRHNKAWQDYLGRAAEDAGEFGKPQEEVDSTFLAAEPLFRAAIPNPDIFGILDRIDVIFAEPIPDGPTQEVLLAA